MSTESAEVYGILGMEWCWLTWRWVWSHGAQLYCGARGISDGWCNADGPVGMLRLQMDKYFRGDDTEISFHCLMDGWRSMRMWYCVRSLTYIASLLLLRLALIYWLVYESRSLICVSTTALRFHHSWQAPVTFKFYFCSGYGFPLRMTHILITASKHIHTG